MGKTNDGIQCVLFDAKRDIPMFLLDETFKMVNFAESQSSNAIEELALLP